jgi:flagellar L-ring protein precursor FlgH
VLRQIGAMVLLMAGVATGLAAAQEAPPPADTLQVAPRALPQHSSWFSDAVSLKVGDIVTVIVDEQTSASERVSNIGEDKRSLTAELSAEADGESAVGATGLKSSWNTNSRLVGEAARRGALTGIVTAQIVGIDANGIAEIKGQKTLTVDGREQVMTLHGFVRPQDIGAGNVVCSSRLAGATVQYKGKKMGPRLGILGRIISIIWP